MELICPHKNLEFEIEQDSFKENLTCQITKVNGENTKITDKKIYNLAILKIGEKRKREIETLNSVIMRNKQGFDQPTNLIQSK